MTVLSEDTVKALLELCKISRTHRNFKMIRYITK